jgi:hypothetical protein
MCRDDYGDFVELLVEHLYWPPVALAPLPFTCTTGPFNG